MLRTLTVGNVLQASSGLKDRILLENMPSGQEHLQTVVDAMTNGHRLRVGYWKSYNQMHRFLLSPYCLKVFRQRWYLVGQNPEYAEGDIRVYALDRLLELEEDGSSFVMPDTFSPQRYFENDFGVFTGGNAKVEDVVIRA